MASIFVVPLVQVFLGVFFLIALLYGFRALTLFAGLLLAMGLGANIWCRMSPHGLRCDLSVDRQRVFPGERLELRIRAVNAKSLPVLLRIALSFDKSIRGPDNEDAGFLAECGLLWYQRFSFKKDLVPRRRGLYHLGPPYLASGDLFGFCRREVEKPSPIDIIVYPRLVEIKHISLPSRDFYGKPGVRSPVEDPVFIYGTKDYQPGTPARRIHWKASARHNRLQEKLCEPAEQEKILILLDAGGFAGSQAEDAFERIVEEAASYAVWLKQKGRAVGFATNGAISGNGSSIIPVTESPVQLSLILEALARVGMQTRMNLMDMLSQGYNLPWGVSCLAFSYEEGDETADLKAYLRHRNIPTVFVYARKAPTFHEVQNEGVEGRSESQTVASSRFG